MVSCRHKLQDDRIYWKEALSLQKAGYRVIHIGVGNTIADFLTPEGIRLIQIAYRRYFSNRLINKIFRRLLFRQHINADILLAADQLKADVYHLHDLEINTIGPKLKKLPWQPIVIYDVHESYPDLIRDHSPAWLKPWNRVRAWYAERWELRAAHYYDAIIATEPFVFNRFRNAFPRKLCSIIYNYSYFMPAAEMVKDIPKIYDAIYSGTITATRGIYEIAEAVRLAKTKLPSIRVLVIGSFSSNSLKLDIQSFIDRHQLSETLILCDAVPFTAMPGYYLASKIGLCVLHPLQLYKNAVFIKIFEYMAFGLPVIASNFGTQAQYVSDTCAGICIDPMNPVSLSNALLTLLNDPETCKQYSSNGMKAVGEKYNWQQESYKLLAIYRQLLTVAE